MEFRSGNLPLGFTFFFPNLISPSLDAVESRIISGASSPDFEVAALLSSGGEPAKAQRRDTWRLLGLSVSCLDFLCKGKSSGWRLVSFVLLDSSA